MKTLWRWFCLRHLQSYKGRAFLCLLGVALGVGVFVGIKTAASTAMASFQDTVRSLTGSTQLQVVGQGNGFAEELFVQVASAKGVQAATPLLEFNVRAASPVAEPLLLLGVDVFTDQQFREYQFVESARNRRGIFAFLTEPDTVALSEKFARRHGLKKGDRVEILSGSQRLSFTLGALLRLKGPARALEGNIALVDVATAQEAFQRLGRLDRIDLLLEPDATLSAVRRRLLKGLPADTRVEVPEKRLGRIREMVAAYRLNLVALSLISLFVGVFLIYSTVDFAVSKRRYEVAMLRVLGTQRRQVLGLFLAEALTIGLLGAVLGAGLGVVMAKLALKSMTRTISELYLITRAQTLSISPLVIFLGGSAAVAVALAGALVPALEASRTFPRDSLYRGTLERKLHMSLGKITVAGAAILGLAYLCSRQPPVRGIPFFGFVAAFLLLVGFSFLTPAGVLLINRALGPAVGRLFNLEGKLACRYLGRSLNRSWVAIVSLMAALAMLFSISLMVLSFRQTVVVWMEQVLAADLYLSPGARLKGQRGGLPAELVDALPGLAGVAAVESLLEMEIHIGSLPTMLDVSDLDVKEQFSGMMFRRGSSSEILHRCRQWDQVCISEVLANRLGLREGDRIEIATPGGRRTFKIAGVYYDYRTEGGRVLMDRATYNRYWGEDRQFSSAGLYVQPGTEPEHIRSTIRRQLEAGQEILIRSNRELRREILRIFDETFSITYALQLIAMVVAIFGIVNTLLQLVGERERDIGVLKAVGATSGQVQKLTVLEAGLMGVVSYFLGAMNGVLLSLLLIFVINKQSFGWTIHPAFPPMIFAKTLLLVLLCSLVAGIAPARAATAKSVNEAMKLE
ncbi:MAG: FtsX-like permease family protein [Syntrophobacteria bacterium]